MFYSDARGLFFIFASKVSQYSKMYKIIQKHLELAYRKAKPDVLSGQHALYTALQATYIFSTGIVAVIHVGVFRKHF